MHAYPGPQLHIISKDKKFAISYQPGQKNENPFLIVKGSEFEGLDCSGTQWIRVKVPEWDDTQITPGFVRRLIDWCLEQNDGRVRVDYLGGGVVMSPSKTFSLLRTKVFLSFLLLVALNLNPVDPIAQINFGKPTSETAMLQDSVNSCAEKQTKTICLNALAHIQLMRTASKATPQTADSIMLDAVELVPLYVIARLYELDEDCSHSCAFARMGQTHNANIVSDAARLSARDPEAFRNLDKSLSELAVLGENFTDILAKCDEV